MRCIPIVTMAFFLMTLIPASTAAQAQQGWVQLGCRDVDFNLDRDVVRVDRREGRFTAIRLRAAGNAVRMLDLKVVYSNGEPDDLPVRAVIPPGGQSGALDLRGYDRGIDRIEMIYASAPNFRGRARICVDGREARPPVPAAVWVQLGCRDVSLDVDRDVLHVDRRDGRFTAIRLRAVGNNVRMHDLKVVYGNGEPDDIPVRTVISAGGQSGALDLRGHERSIERIEMVYVSGKMLRGRARICVDGRAAF
jgi:hypothetical protein